MVTLLDYTPSPELLIALSAKLCYTPSTPEKIVENYIKDLEKRINKLTPHCQLPLTVEKIDNSIKLEIPKTCKIECEDDPEITSFINMLFSMGHLTPFEHTTYNFLITCSRTTSHQLVRHRVASFSQKSQRHVSESNMRFVTPPSLINNTKYNECIKIVQDTYNKLCENVSQEAARYILPNACETHLVVSMNCRELYHFFNLRCCNRAEWEIRNVAKEMLYILRFVSPILFNRAGPTCFISGSCPEKKMTCSKINEVKQEFSELKINEE